jgi:hypothetical protein
MHHVAQESNGPNPTAETARPPQGQGCTLIFAHCCSLPPRAHTKEHRLQGPEPYKGKPTYGFLGECRRGNRQNRRKIAYLH